MKTFPNENTARFVAWCVDNLFLGTYKCRTTQEYRDITRYYESCAEAHPHLHILRPSETEPASAIRDRDVVKRMQPTLEDCLL